MNKMKQLGLLTILCFASMSAAAVPEAPNVKLPGLDGEIDLQNFRGKVVYLDFWASWCKPCVKSFPWMKQMKTTYADEGLEIIAVNLDRDRKLAEAFLEKIDVNFRIAFDPEGGSATTYELRGMPSSYLIGRDGKLYASHIGFREKDKPKMEQAIKQLLGY